ERALRMTWTPEQQKHYDTLIRQGYSPDDARMLVAFTRDRGDTPSLPKPKPTFDYKADLDARLAGPMRLAEGVQRFGRGFLETMGEAAGAPPVERHAPQPKAVEAIAAQRAPEPEAAPAPKPNLPSLYGMERPLNPLRADDPPEVKEWLRRRVLDPYGLGGTRMPMGPGQELKRDEVEQLRQRLSRMEGLNKMGEGLSSIGNVTSASA